MAGGTGVDIYVSTSATDTIVELSGGGADTEERGVDKGGVALAANVENLTLTGTVVVGVGNSLANTITGNAVGNRLFGGGHSDVLSGFGGQDELYGEIGNDALEGGDSADLLDAGAGRDLLRGGAGPDSFVLTLATDSMPNSNRDTIDGWESVADQIRLDLDANDLTPGTIEAFVFDGTAASFAANAPGVVRVEAISVGGVPGVIVWSNTDNDPTAEFSIQVNGVAMLAQDDFIF